MENREMIQAVQRMQEFILANSDIDMEGLAAASGYSRYHAIRLFKQYTGQTPSEYIRSLRLSQAAVRLRDSDEKVLDVALDTQFHSHDGFTRAFSRRFGIAPSAYQKIKPPISLFTYYPVTHQALLYYNKKVEPEMNKAKVPAIVTAQTVERPARKLILLRSKKAEDYMTYCGEMGCEWEGMMNSVAEKFDSAALVQLPAHLVTPGTSDIAAGIEVPADYAKPIPDSMDVIDLPPCKMLYFQGMPYENEEDFGVAIEIVAEAVRGYHPELYGLAFAYDTAPRFNFGSFAKSGAKMAVPVVDAK